MTNLLFLISRVNGAASRNLGGVLEDISLEQYWLLLTLYEAAEPMKNGDIAKHLSVTKQNMTGMINRLWKRDLIKRSDDPKDLRSWRIELTRRGRSVVDKNRVLFDERDSTLLSDISERDRQTVQRALAKLIEQLKA